MKNASARIERPVIIREEESANIGARDVPSTLFRLSITSVVISGGGET
jgi:hypothetical protein